MHVERFTTIRLPIEPAEALSQFTPEGERAWVRAMGLVRRHEPQ